MCSSCLVLLPGPQCWEWGWGNSRIGVVWKERRVGRLGSHQAVPQSGFGPSPARPVGGTGHAAWPGVGTDLSCRQPQRKSRVCLLEAQVCGAPDVTGRQGGMELENCDPPLEPGGGGEEAWGLRQGRRWAPTVSAVSGCLPRLRLKCEGRRRQRSALVDAPAPEDRPSSRWPWLRARAATRGAVGPGGPGRLGRALRPGPTEGSKFELCLIVSRTSLWLRC